MREITVPWAKLQFPDKWPSHMYECEIWDEVTCPEGGTAIDIGAHYGFYTTKLAREAGPEGRVLAFEPDETNRGVLEKNLEQNNLNAQVFKCALSNYQGTGTLFTYGQEGQDGKDSGKHFLRGSIDQEAFYKEYHQGKPAPSPQHDKQVAVTTLDNVVGQISRIDLIKMDVEGAELRVLEGGRATFHKHSPKIVMEVHFNQIDVLGDLLDELDYSMVKYSKMSYSSNPFAVFEKQKKEQGST